VNGQWAAQALIVVDRPPKGYGRCGRIAYRDPAVTLAENKETHMCEKRPQSDFSESRQSRIRALGEEMVGGFRMRIVLAEPTPESRARWERRVDAIAAWLVSEWEREHPRL